MKRILSVLLALILCFSLFGTTFVNAAEEEPANRTFGNTFSTGGYHAAAIKSDGSLWIWGNNGNFQLGVGNEDQSYNALKPECVFESGIVEVELGGFFSMAIDEKGDLYGWGRNSNGQVGNGTWINQSIPAFVMSDVARVSAGFQHTLALKEDGTLWAWGSNDNGQLGTGEYKTVNMPTQIMTDVVDFCAGSYHNLALKSDGTLWAWGLNAYGQLGVDNMYITNTPVQIMEGYQIASISCGNAHTAVVTTNGDLYMFGQNVNHQCGVAESTDKIMVPTLVMKNVKKAACGTSHSLILTENNELYVVGSNVRHQCRPGDEENYEYSSPVLYLTGVEDIDTYADFNLIVRNGNELFGYGWNNEGELAQGTNNIYPNPVLIFDSIALEGCHDTELQNAVEATCTTEGYTGDEVCKICGEIIVEGEVIPKIACPSAAFSDLDTSKWYHEGTDFVLANGLMYGMNETEFAPDGDLTRAQLVAILYRMAGSPSVEGLENPFKDVPAGKWYTDAVVWAYHENVVAGTTETTFEPDVNITRDQIAAILYRYSGAEKVEEDHLSAFTDAGQISGYAVDAMNWAVANGYIYGMTETVLAPKATATRAQGASILMRYCK